jgi:nicotinate-nucleotide adenylyltransferase
MTGLFGGMFDPPHNGHVAVVAGAARAFSFSRMLILVVAEPGHRSVRTPVDVRRALAQCAFPDYAVETDEHPRTIDMLRARRLDDPVLVIGADELAAFPGWKSPGEVLELARLAVAVRPGFPIATDVVPPDRLLTFEIEPQAVSSTEIRRRVAAGEPVDALVPPAVASEIERLGLYRD